MNTDDLWAKRHKQEGTLDEDGHYYGDIENCEAKATESGWELLEILIRVSEGQYQGEQVKQTIAYQDPNGAREQGHKTIYTLMQRLDKALGSQMFETAQSFAECLCWFEVKSIGRRVSFEQKPSKDGKKYIYIHEFQEVSTPASKEAVPF